MVKGEPFQFSERTVRIHCGIALLIVIVDQVTKWLILSTLEPYSSTAVTGFFNLVLVYNRGAAFGFLANSNFDVNLFFLIANFVVLLVLFIALRTLCPPRSQSATAIWLIIGGAIGNMIDRLVHGHVIDFLDFHYAGWHYSAFNVADSAITIGAILLAMEMLGLRVIFRKSNSVKTDSLN